MHLLIGYFIEDMPVDQRKKSIIS